MEGQVYSTCASPCTFTCDNVNELVCITLCTTGCDCPGGRVIDTELNKCVAVNECPNMFICLQGLMQAPLYTIAQIMLSFVMQFFCMSHMHTTWFCRILLSWQW